MSQTKTVLGLDIGAARIGVAMADDRMRIAVPYGAIEVDGTELEQLSALVREHNVETVVVGYPRNQSGESTQQTATVEAAVEPLKSIAQIVFQDESLTSVTAENRLKSYKKPYTRGDIDSEAAVIILEDYLETH